MAVATFAEHKVAFDVEGLDLDVGQGDGDALLMVGGEECEGLLGRTHVRATRRGHERRKFVRVGCMLSSWKTDTQTIDLYAFKKHASKKFV